MKSCTRWMDSGGREALDNGGEQSNARDGRREATGEVKWYNKKKSRNPEVETRKETE